MQQNDISVGTRVRWVVFEKGEDHGHPTEWGIGHVGTVVQINGNGYLCEEKDGTRMWASKVVSETVYLEKKAKEEAETKELWDNYRPDPNAVILETS